MTYTRLTSKPLTQPVRNLSGWRRKVSGRDRNLSAVLSCGGLCVLYSPYWILVDFIILTPQQHSCNARRGSSSIIPLLCIFSFSVPDGWTVLTYNRMIRPENKLSPVDTSRYCDRNTEPSPREIASPLIAPTFHTHVCDRSTNDFPRSKGKSFFLTARR